MSVVEDLKAARAEVAKGWIKHRAISQHGVCAVGAINRVCQQQSAGIYVGMDWPRRDAAVNELWGRLPAGYGQVSEYNDKDSTTQQDILDLYDKTIADLGGMV